MSNTKDSASVIIKQLDPITVQQIAAGEVIERPASIVKELLENSIDAGATRIDLFLTNGGLDSIKIVDDGHGIADSMLDLAVTLHATSKLEKLDDLNHLHSLGFRGEALASINAISNLVIESKTKNSNVGTQFSAGKKTVISCLQGTTIRVNNIFDNIPVRKKFLKSNRSEFIYIEEVWRKLALANPHIGFCLYNNNKLIKKLDSTKSNVDLRLQQIIGKAKANNFLSIQSNSEFSELKLNGLIQTPDTASDVCEHQYVFLNNRPLKDKLLLHAIKEAWQGIVPLHKNLMFSIFLYVSPDQFDVNVHPTKHEVIFMQARMVHDFVYHAVKQVLESFSHKKNNVDLFSVAAEVQEINIEYEKNISSENKHNLNTEIKYNHNLHKENMNRGSGNNILQKSSDLNAFKSVLQLNQPFSNVLNPKVKLEDTPNSYVLDKHLLFMDINSNCIVYDLKKSIEFLLINMLLPTDKTITLIDVEPFVLNCSNIKLYEIMQDKIFNYTLVGENSICIRAIPAMYVEFNLHINWHAFLLQIDRSKEQDINKIIHLLSSNIELKSYHSIDLKKFVQQVDAIASRLEIRILHYRANVSASGLAKLIFTE